VHESSTKLSDADLGEALLKVLSEPLTLAGEALQNGTSAAMPHPRERIPTLRHLFNHRRPPLDLVLWVMQCTAASPESTGSIPAVVVDALHTASIALALTRCNWSSSELDVAQLQSDLKTKSCLIWLTHDLENLLDEAISFHFDQKFSPPADMTVHPTMASTLAEIEESTDLKTERVVSKISRHWRSSPIYRYGATALFILMLLPLIFELIPSNEVELGDYEGVHEAGNGSAIVGWAWDRATPNLPVSVTIDDGMHHITIPADQEREDLLAQGKGNGKHGFVYEIPPSQRDGRPRKVWIRIADTQRILEGTPRTTIYR